MKRLVLAAVLAVAACGPAAAAPPEIGSPGGYCDGDVDVVCRPYRCEPDLPCTIEFCGLWLEGRCHD